MAEFVDRHDLGHVRHAVDVDGVVWNAFEIPAQPAWVFIDGATGQVTTRFGALTAQELSSELATLEASGSVSGRDGP